MWSPDVAFIDTIVIPVGAISVDLILRLLILNRHIILEREIESYTIIFLDKLYAAEALKVLLMSFMTRSRE